jgi:DMSO/TMAO reductase YedYZ molybdopterin-dependent catalytic subunit
MPRHPARDRLAHALPGALSGVLAAVAGIAVGHLVAGLLDPASSPVLAVGSAVIDATPTPVKEWAVARFGTSDKPLLLAGVIAVTLLAAAASGVLARRRLWPGVVFVLMLSGLATLAALLRPVATPVDAAPGLAAAVVGVAVLAGLLTALRARAAPRDRATLRGRATLRRGGRSGTSSGGALPATAHPTAHDSRRTFLLGAGAVTLGAAGAATVGQRLSTAGSPGATALPRPVEAAPPLPQGLERTVRGITPLRTGNATFYRVDTNLTVPRVDADRWQLRVDGMVDRPFSLFYRQLLALPMVERDITMTCVSNEVGGGYVGSARWLGVRLADVLQRAGVRDGADQLLSTAVDGFTISTPLDAVRDGRDALLVVGMNGEPLPAAHGYPARLIVPGLYGFVGATKWVTRLTLSTYARDTAYWTQRKWATDAPIKMSARIDTPRPLSTVKAGPTAIGGVAWAQHRGVRDVEVSVDNGPWRRAELGPDVGIDYWRQWYLRWDAMPGRHSIRVRTSDLAGDRQLTERATPFPSGSSGVQQVVVFVS